MEPGDDDELDSHNSRHSPKLIDSAVGGGGNHDAMSNQSLLDIIRDDGGGSKESRKTWRHFKDKIKNHGHANVVGKGSAWTSTVPVPTSDIPISNNKSWMMSRHPSTRISSSLDSDPTIQADISAVSEARCPSLLRNPSRPVDRGSGRLDFDGPMKRLQREENEEEEDEEEDNDDMADAGGMMAEEDGEEQRPVRMSLMSLLQETDEDGIEYGMGDDDEDEDEEDGAVEYNNCCICMVRHKGTAFEPCGHSFCRLCSREMWVQGGNCPLCNNYILEILDIF